MIDNDQLAVAAVVHAANDSASKLLADFARHLRGQGWRVQGVVKEDAPPRTTCARKMALVDLDDDTRFVISQDLGPGSTSCCVDPGGISAASVVLRRAVAKSVELVVVNRFGELEADGGGFSAEMLELMASGTPLLTVVAEKYLEKWRYFTGNAAMELPPRREALEAWFAGLGLHRKGPQ